MTAPIPTRPIVALAIAGCGSAAALRVCDPLLPFFAREHGVGLAAAAQTVTAFAIAYGLFQLAYGPIGDRYGKYRVITIATFGCALTSLACAFAPTLPTLVVARALAGATAGALIPLSLAWIGDSVAYERRQPVLARYLIGQMFGLALGAVLGGIGADLVGAGPVFVVLAAWFAAAAVLLWRFAPAHGPAVATSQEGALRRFASVLGVRWSRVVLLTVFVEGMLLVGALAFVPTHLHLAYGLPLTAAGAVVMAFAAGGLIFATLSPLLVRRLGEPGLAAAGGVLMALFFVGVAIRSTPVVAALACLVGGLGFYMLHTLTISMSFAAQKLSYFTSGATVSADFDKSDVELGFASGSNMSFVNNAGKSSFKINTHKSVKIYSVNEKVTATAPSGVKDMRIALRASFNPGAKMGTCYIYEWKYAY